MTADATPLDDDPPLVSVVMPVRNESRFIARSLGAVLRQDWPRLEVVIADGGSTDDTRAQIAALAAQHPRVPVIVIDNPAGIVAPGLNRAIRRSRGAIVVRVDGHTEIATDYVRCCVAALASTGADNVGGRMDAVAASTPWGRAIADATSHPAGVGGAQFHYLQRGAWVDTVYLGAWRRTVFARIGGFDESLVRNQDDEFNYRLRARGGRIWLDPSIRSRYHGRADLDALARQYGQYGLWKVRVMQKHPRQMRPRQFAPAALVIALALGLLATPWRLGRRALGLLLASYGAVLGAAAVQLGARRGDLVHALRLPIVFATLHLSYGAGFLLGLTRFGGLTRAEDAAPTMPRDAAIDDPDAADGANDDHAAR